MLLNKRLISGRGLVLALGLAAIMGTIVYAGQEALVKSVGDALAECNVTKAQLAATMSSLNKLLATKPGNDLRPAYEAYVVNVDKTRKDAEATKLRVAQMNSDSATYFSSWKSDNEKISNQQLRKVAMKRLQEVQKDYSSSLASLQAASAKFVPLLSDLGDIQTALSNDLTAKGLKAAKDVFKKANHDQDEVQKEVVKAIQHFTATQTALSPTAGTK